MNTAEVTFGLSTRIHLIPKWGCTASFGPQSMYKIDSQVPSFMLSEHGHIFQHFRFNMKIIATLVILVGLSLAPPATATSNFGGVRNRHNG